MPEYINYNQGLYNVGNYNQRLATVAGATIAANGDLVIGLNRIQPFDGVIAGNAAVAADIARFAGLDAAAGAVSGQASDIKRLRLSRRSLPPPPRLLLT